MNLHAVIWITRIIRSFSAPLVHRLVQLTWGSSKSEFIIIRSYNYETRLQNRVSESRVPIIPIIRQRFSHNTPGRLRLSQIILDDRLSFNHGRLLHPLLSFHWMAFSECALLAFTYSSLSTVRFRNRLSFDDCTHWPAWLPTKPFE